MPRLEIALLGPPRLQIDGNLIETDRRKVIALLAYLAVTGKAQAREHLVTLFWPDVGRDNAYASLRRTLWELNNALGKEWLDATRETVALSREAVWLDTDAFQTLLDRYRKTASTEPGAVEPLLEAIPLYREDFLAGFHVQDSAAFDDWQTQQAEAFRQEFAWALEKLVEGCEHNGEYEAALPHARRWLALDPLGESAHRALMRLYARMGDRAGAVRQYETCAQILNDELGVPPQRETTALYEQIVRGDIQGARPARAEHPDPGPPSPAFDPDKPTHLQPFLRLPLPSTPFIGRRLELEQIKSIVQSPACRLLTLTGTGGTGKTRLSIQAAAELDGPFLDGIFFVPLDSLNTGESMVSAIAKALNFFFYQGETLPRQQLLDYLREKYTLLILDNFEHLITQENIRLVLDLLATSKGVKILATSRSRLNIQGEQLFPVSGLTTPDGKLIEADEDPETHAQAYSALELFVERARRVRPTFRLTYEDLDAVIQICQLVQGAPLGIELAAAWLELLPLHEIAAEITRSLDFLETDLEGVPERHRSLRAVFESSWNFLDQMEREAFQKLSVFQGSFSREAAQQVSGASLRTLLGLANKSWLQQVDDGRFHLHELLRQYANELLWTHPEAGQAARDGHAAFYAEFVQTQGRALRGAGQIAALDAVASEFNSNIRAAWLWLTERRQFETMMAQLMPGLFHFCLIRSLGPELIPLLKQARQAVEKESGRENQVRLAILMTAETYMETRYRLLDNSPMERLAQTWALVKKDDLEEEMGFWFVLLAREYIWEIAFDEGSQHLHAALSRIRARVTSGQEDVWVWGWNLLALGRVAIKARKDEENAPHLNEALNIFQLMGVFYEQALTLLSLGDVAWRQKKSTAECAQLYQDARQLFEQVGDPFGVAAIWRILADIYLLGGEIELASQAFNEQGQVYKRIGNRHPPTGSGTFFGNRDSIGTRDARR